MDRTNTKIVWDAIRPQFPPQHKKDNATGGSKDVSASLAIKTAWLPQAPISEEKETKRGESEEMAERTHIWLLKSFIISKKWLYTSGLSWNCTLTASR